MKKICVVTGTRAEYGLLKRLMRLITQSQLLKLQIVATGMHLAPEFGQTIREIESDKFFVDKKIEMLLSSDTSVGVTKSIGLGMIGFADAFQELDPDIVLLLGDRFELLAAASAALIARIPIAHIHGGETTEGAFDEAIRHSITKMAHLHFTAAEPYRNRVIQLGEDPQRVINCGGLGVDAIQHLKLLSKNQLEEKLEIEFSKRNLMITFHPVTLEKASAARQMSELLAALSELENTTLIFTMPNADTDGRTIFKLIDNFCNQGQRRYRFLSVGQLAYLSLLKFVDGVVGNSSSGLLEVPTFKKATINIGDRQKGRLSASSVVNCGSTKAEIGEALMRVYSPEFQKSLPNTVSPYGEGGAAKVIVETLEKDFYHGLKKRFYDLQLQLKNGSTKSG